MATYTDSLGFNKGTAAFPYTSDSGVSKFEVALNFATIIAARAAAGVTALAAADVLQVINLPAGSIVLAAGLNVTTAETVNTTATFSFGYTGASPYAVAAYASAVASNSTGVKATDLANPSVIVAADTIDLLLNTAAPTNCVVNAWAIVADAN
jgi:hypothetical protein